MDEDDTNVVEEDSFLHQINTDQDGNLYQSNQVDDYLHHDEALSHIHWYDFGRCFRKVKKHTKTSENTSILRYGLLTSHLDWETHELVQVIDPRHKRPHPECILRIVGTKIPRLHDNDDTYASFMLCHFIPFSAHNPLDLTGGIWESYQRAMGQNNTTDQPQFSTRAKEIMQNWDEIHECEDVRDADRLRKCQTANKKMRKYTREVVSQLPPEFWDDPASVKAAERGLKAELDSQTAFTIASFIEQTG